MVKNERLKLVWGILAVLFIWQGCSASQSDPNVQVEEENEILKKFFICIDQEVRKLIPQNPQLINWEMEKTDPQWYSAGKKLTRKQLIYNHALSRSKSSNYKDWYERNGCQHDSQ